MTMHLVGPYMTTTNYKRRKAKKPTQKQLQKYIQDMKSYNKRMRQLHAHDQQMTLDEYIDYIHGVYTPKKKRRSLFLTLRKNLFAEKLVISLVLGLVLE